MKNGVHELDGRSDGDVGELPEEEDLLALPFGVDFFVEQLPELIREQCSGSDRIPSVTVHLAGGEELLVCNVVGVASRWVALVVYDGRGDDGAMRTELVPYAAITRVTVREEPVKTHIGFSQRGAPRLVTPSSQLE